MEFKISECYERMNEGDVILSYKGSITADLITNVLGLVELKLDSPQEQPNIRKRVYNVLVEILQNLFHHVDEPDISLREFGENFGIFVISRTDDGFLISTGNFIKEDRVDILKGKIDKINEMSKDDLKEYYKQVLNNQKFSEKGGGGLGLIDIAKRTGKKLEYDFYPFNSKFRFFNLNVYITRN